MGQSVTVNRNMLLAQAKGERDTLVGRIKITQESIETLEKSLSEPTADTLYKVEAMLEALIAVNLTQLRGNLKEGTDRVTYLDEAIKQAESPVHKATLVHPARS